MNLQPFVAIKQWYNKAFQKFSMLPFLFILIAIEIYFFINGQAHFENWDTDYSQLIQVYLIMTIIFLIWAGRKTKETLKRPIKDSMLVFVTFFVMTYIVLLFLTSVNLIGGTRTLNPDLFWQTVIMQVCVVATAEELMFRGVILELTGVVISAALFAAWHMYAYRIIWYNVDLSQIQWGAIIFAFVMGLLLGLIAKKKEWGLPATIGIHASYNLAILGAFTMGVT